jgi:energy-coupling factor transport system substrate-specific component
VKPRYDVADSKIKDLNVAFATRMGWGGNNMKLSADIAGFLRRPLSFEPIRFVIGGAFASAINWLSRMALSSVFSFATAVLIAQAIGMSVGFIVYRAWVFPGSRLSLFLQIGQFLAVNAIGTLVVFVASTQLRSQLINTMPVFYAEGLAHALGIAFGAVTNFIGHSVFTFARRK